MKNPNATDPTRAPSSPTSKTTYKDYQKFLQTYDGKSDRSSSPTPLSTNSSASSVPSMISETDNVPVAFNEYLQSYNSKKYGTVKPNFPKKNVKTELFIQVGEEEDKDNLFGRRYNTLKSRKTPSKVILTRNNSWNKCDASKGPLSPAGHQVCISPPPQKQEVVPDELIYAKTALLHELCAKPPKLHKSPSPPLRSPIEVSSVLSISSLPPPPPKLPDFTNATPPISSIVKKVTPATTSQPKPNPNRPSFISEMQSKFKENAQSRLPPRLPTVGLVQNGIIHNKVSPPVQSNPDPPVPPKFPVHHSKSSEIEVTISGYGQNGRQSPVVVSTDVPPPPPPPTTFINQQKITLTARNQNGVQNGQSHFLGVTAKKLPPGTSIDLPPPPAKFLLQPKTLDIEPVTTTYVPVADNTANIDKKDPNVKKLVYNTYRGLLGAYNNKANTMVSMPKNRVVQDQGVAKQLESMELQGCLDKLNGRVNPSGENE